VADATKAVELDSKYVKVSSLWSIDGSAFCFSSPAFIALLPCKQGYYRRGDANFAMCKFKAALKDFKTVSDAATPGAPPQEQMWRFASAQPSPVAQAALRCRNACVAHSWDVVLAQPPPVPVPSRWLTPKASLYCHWHWYSVWTFSVTPALRCSPKALVLDLVPTSVTCIAPSLSWIPRTHNWCLYALQQQQAAAATARGSKKY
jgi:hypothetical protein